MTRNQTICFVAFLLFIFAIVHIKQYGNDTTVNEWVVMDNFCMWYETRGDTGFFINNDC